MRIPLSLTPRQKAFIMDNRHHLTYLQIADKLHFKSVYKVYAFCKVRQLTKVFVLTPDQEDFIRRNHAIMKESTICRQLDITRFRLQKFKRLNGIAKYNGNRKKKSPVSTVFFNVEEKCNWVA